MRVLWFTNIPMPDVNKHFGKEVIGTGGWMGALLALLRNRTELQLGVATACSHYPEYSFQKNGVDYFIIQQKSPRFRRSLFPIDNDPIYLKKCVDIVNSFNPDIVHIHGTERFYSLMMSQGLIQCPVVISIQGIMDACSEWYRWFGKLTLAEIFTITALSSLKFSGLLWEFIEAKKRGQREREFFKKGKYFLGRTEWDKSYLSCFNEQARYFEVNEVLRRPFWEQQWDINTCKKYRIIFTNAAHPRKGTEILIEAMKILKPLYPDIELILIGSLGYGRYRTNILNKINQLKGAIKPIGLMEAKSMARELCKAHLFVSASYIDNGSNSVSEAQLVGMPVISSFTGGVTTTVVENKTGLFFPTGDVPLLVSKIKSIFDNDALAKSLGENSYAMARKRHDPETIIKAQVSAYTQIIQESDELQGI